jgi:flagellar hook-associated protein 1 FlgK
MAFVDGDDYLKLETQISAQDDISITNVVWENTDMEVRFRDGEMAAMIAARDQDVLKYEEYLDTLAKTIVETINQVHRTGYGLDDQTNRSFFDPRFIDAEHISLSDDVLDQPNNIAASAPAGTPGDGSIAQLIADTFKYSRIMDGNTATIAEFYGGIVGRIGIATQESTNYKDNYSMLVQQIENQRQAVQGVSMDEEMINLVKFQNAYDAAARVITTMDQALETLIHNMGVVGR